MRKIKTLIAISMVSLGLASSAGALTLSSAPLKKTTITNNYLYQTLNNKAEYYCTRNLKGPASEDADCQSAVSACVSIYLGDCGDKNPFENCNVINFDSTFTESLGNVSDACSS